MQLNHAVEIIGKVMNDLSVKVMASTDFGPEGGIGMTVNSTLLEWDVIDRRCRFQRRGCGC